jgi:hypothetical protein
MQLLSARWYIPADPLVSILELQGGVDGYRNLRINGE